MRKEYYPHGLQQFSFIFAFKNDFISLKIPKDQELNGWKISPYYNPKVSSLLYDKLFLLDADNVALVKIMVVVSLIPRLIRKMGLGMRLGCSQFIRVISLC